MSHQWGCGRLPNTWKRPQSVRQFFHTHIFSPVWSVEPNREILWLDLSGINTTTEEKTSDNGEATTHTRTHAFMQPCPELEERQEETRSLVVLAAHAEIIQSLYIDHYSALQYISVSISLHRCWISFIYLLSSHSPWGKLDTDSSRGDLFDHLSQKHNRWMQFSVGCVHYKQDPWATPFKNGPFRPLQAIKKCTEQKSNFEVWSAWNYVWTRSVACQRFYKPLSVSHRIEIASTVTLAWSRRSPREEWPIKTHQNH